MARPRQRRTPPPHVSCREGWTNIFRQEILDASCYHPLCRCRHRRRGPCRRKPRAGRLLSDPLGQHRRLPGLERPVVDEATAVAGGLRDRDQAVPGVHRGDGRERGDAAARSLHLVEKTGWAKAPLRRAHRSQACRILVGTLALCPPYARRLGLRLPASNRGGPARCSRFTPTPRCSASPTTTATASRYSRSCVSLACRSGTTIFSTPRRHRAASFPILSTATTRSATAKPSSGLSPGNTG